MSPGKYRFSVPVRVIVVLGAAVCYLAAQEPQAPPGNGAPPNVHPEPPAGAANGPTPGPASTSAPAGKQTGAAARPGSSDRARSFFGLSAAPDPSAVERGQGLFVANCGFCHGSNANGGNSGPNLVRSVLVLHDEGTGSQIGPVILNGRVSRGMPKFNFSDAQIYDIAAFLLNRSQATVNRMDYKILNVVTGDSKAGHAFFSANCASCHSAGDLDHIAAKYEPSVLQSRLLYPVTRNPFGGGPPPDPRSQTTVTVTTQSGATVSGVLDQIDDFNISLTDKAGDYRSFPVGGDSSVKYVLHDPLKAHEELLRKYTDADMHNILAYLETLK